MRGGGAPCYRLAAHAGQNMAAGTLDVGGEQGRGNPAFARQRGLKDGLMLSRDIAVKGVRLKKMRR